MIQLEMAAWLRCIIISIKRTNNHGKHLMPRNTSVYLSCFDRFETQFRARANTLTLIGIHFENEKIAIRHIFFFFSAIRIGCLFDKLCA